MIVRTEAVVLRTLRYGETSRIVTLFTRDGGKVAALARGARTVKSRFGGTVQPLAHVQAVLSVKPTRTLQTLREAAHLTRFPTLAADLGKLSAGLRMVELVSAFLQDEEAAPAIFDLLVTSLGALDATTSRATNALLFFELRLTGYLGFDPRFSREAVAAVGDEGGVLRLDTVEVDAPEATYGAARRASRAALRAFAIAARADLGAVLTLPLTDEAAAEAAALVEAYLRYHTEDAYPTRSNAVRGALDEAAGADAAAAAGGA